MRVGSPRFLTLMHLRLGRQTIRQYAQQQSPTHSTCESMRTDIPTSGPRTSTRSHFAGLLRSALRYLSARLSLAGIEAKEAWAQYVIAAVLVAGGLCVGAVGYMFLATTVVFGIATAFAGEYAWIWVMGIAAILHLAFAAALVSVGFRRMRSAVFPTTLNEIKKDKEWLNNLANKP